MVLHTVLSFTHATVLLRFTHLLPTFYLHSYFPHLPPSAILRPGYHHHATVPTPAFTYYILWNTTTLHTTIPRSVPVSSLSLYSGMEADYPTSLSLPTYNSCICPVICPGPPSPPPLLSTLLSLLSGNGEEEERTRIDDDRDRRTRRQQGIIIIVIDMRGGGRTKTGANRKRQEEKEKLSCGINFIKPFHGKGRKENRLVLLCLLCIFYCYVSGTPNQKKEKRWEKRKISFFYLPYSKFSLLFPFSPLLFLLFLFLLSPMPLSMHFLFFLL